MSVSVVAVIWSLLSAAVAVAFWCSLLQPFWFVNTDSMTSLGVYSYCVRRYDDDDVTSTLAPPIAGAGARSETSGIIMRQNCQVYGGRFQFSRLPSTFWQATCVLLGCASVLASVSALLALLTLCLPRQHDSTVARVAGYVQIVAALLFTGGLAVFPVGLSSDYARQICGRTSKSYWPGDCGLGWSCVLAVVSDALAVFCPFLSRHIHTQLTR